MLKGAHDRDPGACGETGVVLVELSRVLVPASRGCYFTRFRVHSGTVVSFVMHDRLVVSVFFVMCKHVSRQTQITDKQLTNSIPRAPTQSGLCSPAALFDLAAHCTYDLAVHDLARQPPARYLLRPGPGPYPHSPTH